MQQSAEIRVVETLLQGEDVRDLLHHGTIIMPSDSISILESFLSREANYRSSPILGRESDSEEAA